MELQIADIWVLVFVFFPPVESVNFLRLCQLRFRVKPALSYRTHSASDTASLSTRHMAKVVPLRSLIKSEAHQIGKTAILLSLPSVSCTKLNPEIILISSREGHLRKVNLSKWKILERGSPRKNWSYHQHGVMPFRKRRLSLSSTALLDIRCCRGKAQGEGSDQYLSLILKDMWHPHSC